MTLALLVLLMLTAPAPTEFGAIPKAVQVSFNRPGDVILGAIFPFHSDELCSGKMGKWANEMVALIMFAIDEVHRREDLLPNITIGFDFRDDCYSEKVSLWSALALASTSERPTEDVEFKHITTPDRGNLFCIIGTESSGTSIIAAQAASLYHIPLISAFATSNELSNKRRFPYFIRTVAPDKLQASAIIDILLRYGWKYIGLFFDLSSYGIHGAQAVLDLSIKHDICVAFSVSVRSGAPQSELEEAALNLVKFPKAKVVVMFMSTSVAGLILNTISRMMDPPNITYIGTDGWTHTAFLNDNINRISDLHGGIFIVPYYHSIPGFSEYYRALQHNPTAFNPWFQEYRDNWMNDAGCSNLTACPIPIDNNDAAVVDSVYAYAYALHNLLEDQCGNSLNCSSIIPTITGHDFLPYLKSVNFQGMLGNYSFDANGDASGNYRVLTFQVRNSVGRFERMGEWLGYHDDHLYIRTPPSEWVGGSMDPPTSLCRDWCDPGFIEVPLEQKCCSGCQKCPDNAIVRNSSCEACPEDQWPDISFAECQPITPTPPDWNEPVVVAIIASSCLGVGLSGMAAAGLVYYRHHALMKAASRELSSINILGLSLAFLSPFLLLISPTDVSCRVSEILVSICFCLTYAPTLLKVNRIHRIFEAGKKSNKCPRFIGSGPLLLMVFGAVVVMVFISIVGTFVDPTKPAKLSFFPPTNYIEAYCKFGYGFLASIAYNLLLILACCYFAFKARRVPSNYNESKFIALSVYSTLVFGMAAVPVYITAQFTLQKVATLCVAILLNSFLTLFCVYLPKLYAILLAKDVELCEWRANTGSTDVAGGTTTSAASRRGTAQVQPAPEEVKQVTDQDKEK